MPWPSNRRLCKLIRLKMCWPTEWMLLLCCQCEWVRVSASVEWVRWSLDTYLDDEKDAPRSPNSSPPDKTRWREGEIFQILIQASLHHNSVLCVTACVRVIPTRTNRCVCVLPNAALRSAHAYNTSFTTCFSLPETRFQPITTRRWGKFTLPSLFSHIDDDDMCVWTMLRLALEYSTVDKWEFCWLFWTSGATVPFSPTSPWTNRTTQWMDAKFRVFDAREEHFTGNGNNRLHVFVCLGILNKTSKMSLSACGVCVCVCVCVCVLSSHGKMSRSRRRSSLCTPKHTHPECSRMQAPTHTDTCTQNKTETMHRDVCESLTHTRTHAHRHTHTILHTHAHKHTHTGVCSHLNTTGMFVRCMFSQCGFSNWNEYPSPFTPRSRVFGPVTSPLDGNLERCHPWFCLGKSEWLPRTAGTFRCAGFPHLACHFLPLSTTQTSCVHKHIVLKFPQREDETGFSKCTRTGRIFFANSYSPAPSVVYLDQHIPKRKCTHCPCAESNSPHSRLRSAKSREWDLRHKAKRYAGLKSHAKCGTEHLKAKSCNGDWTASLRHCRYLCSVVKCSDVVGIHCLCTATAVWKATESNPQRTTELFFLAKHAGCHSFIKATEQRPLHVSAPAKMGRLWHATLASHWWKVKPFCPMARWTSNTVSVLHLCEANPTKWH